MCGYMTKLLGYVFEGELKNLTDTDVANGQLLTHGMKDDELGWVLPAADAKWKFELKEKTTIYDGIPAYRFSVKAMGDQPLGLVENALVPDNTTAYDTTEYTVAKDKLIRVKQYLIPGEEFLVSAAEGSALVVGTDYGVKADGTIG